MRFGRREDDIKFPGLKGFMIFLIFMIIMSLAGEQDANDAEVYHVSVP